MNSDKYNCGNIIWDRLITHSSMSENDVAEAVEIERTTIYSPWTGDMFLKEIGGKNSGLTAFKFENRLIGYFCFWKVFDEAHLLNLSLHVDFRGKGLGRFLINCLEEACKSMDISKIILEVAETNYAAIKLYNKCGFIRVGLRKRFYEETGDDAILMEKRIQRC